MLNPNYVIFYVNDPTASVSFYADLLNQQPIEFSPTFAMFALKPDLMLGLWSKQEVEPTATLMGGGGELGISVASVEAVKTLHEQWVQLGVVILQSPVPMDFGFTFVALDPDGHRIRVFKANT